MRSYGLKVTPKDEADRGYVVALGALALLPVIAAVALAVDLAMWHGRGAELQRVADAAALAAASQGSVPQAAEAAARRVAAKNGLVAGLHGIDLEVEVLGPAHVRVEVIDNAIPSGFAGSLVGPVRLAREATAEHVRPVALGSPRNFLGTGNLAGNTNPYTGLPGVAVGDAEDFWLSVSGPCSSREQGDWLLAYSVANHQSGNPPVGARPWRGCTPRAHPGVQPSASFDPAGYSIGFVVPDDYPGGPFTIQVFDGARCVDSPVDFGARDDPFWTRMQVLDAVADGQPPATARVLATQIFLTGARCGDDPILPNGFSCGNRGSWKGRWCNLATVATPVPGETYLLKVDTGSVSDHARHQLNSYSVRVRNGPAVATGGFTPCTTDPTDTAVVHAPSTCIGVHGMEWLSIFALGSRPTPTFFLADVGPEHSGSELEVALFDIGEGASSVQVLDPNGMPAAFIWDVVDEGGDAMPTGGWSGEVPAGGALDVRGVAAGNACGGGNPQPGPGRNSSSKYNDRMLRLRIPLPADIVAAYGGRQWWRVRYFTCEGRGASDRTTWGASVAGQPLRLVR